MGGGGGREERGVGRENMNFLTLRSHRMLSREGKAESNPAHVWNESTAPQRAHQFLWKCIIRISNSHSSHLPSLSCPQGFKDSPIVKNYRALVKIKLQAPQRGTDSDECKLFQPSNGAFGV